MSNINDGTFCKIVDDFKPLSLREKCPNTYGVISGPYFPVFGLNTGKYGPEVTPYLETFHVVYFAKVFLKGS